MMKSLDMTHLILFPIISSLSQLQFFLTEFYYWRNIEQEKITLFRKSDLSLENAYQQKLHTEKQIIRQLRNRTISKSVYLEFKLGENIDVSGMQFLYLINVSVLQYHTGFESNSYKTLYLCEIVISGQFRLPHIKCFQALY